MTTHTTYYTYILECSDGTYYVGMTKDIKHRLSQHNGEKPGGAKYTKTRKPSILRYTETYETHREAAQREYTLKKLSHQKKKTLCLRNIPLH